MCRSDIYCTPMGFAALSGWVEVSEMTGAGELRLGTRMILHVPFVAYQELAGEELGDDACTLGRGVDEVGADHGRMAVVPAGHGAVAAHGLVGVEEATAGLLRRRAAGWRRSRGWRAWW